MKQLEQFPAKALWVSRCHRATGGSGPFLRRKVVTAASLVTGSIRTGPGSLCETTPAKSMFSSPMLGPRFLDPRQREASRNQAW